ncbi:siderophore ABC transporter substrate-binding protein [Oryzicola mucosus]|uniref:Siderophore ABC transporter substrate-binding protein n=1 Tax=Oryzicola mucosus TaxID=2767425 RepID=A0A8J6TYV8_9HYPH|nr:siderophore ABC transporter substrate-binding protein [Oryzicola mucosus]MBD0415404.1 siderophore ABC transporter substrate-binding protein [Oryzicola mucosus]
MRVKSVVAAFAAILVSGFAAQAAEISTAKGPVTIDATPAKIAVFDIAALDTIDRLGIKPAGIPEKLYVSYLDDLKQGSEVVGDLFEPNLEALSALGPDLIIVGGRSSTKAEATAQVAPTIDMTMDGDDLIVQAKERLASYGDLFDRKDEAQAAIKELEAEVAAARAAVQGKGKGLIIMTNGPKVSAYGAGSRFGWIHAALGLPPAVETIEASGHGEAVSFEFIREANPDWLLVLDRAAAIGSGEQGAKATLDNELVAQTTAWKTGQVIYMPAPEFYIAAGGVQSMQSVMATITKAFSAAQ